MPFDAAGFPPKPPPERPRPNGHVLATLVAVLAALLLLTPISLAGCVDLVHYVASRR